MSNHLEAIELWTLIEKLKAYLETECHLQQFENDSVWETVIMLEKAYVKMVVKQ